MISISEKLQKITEKFALRSIKDVKFSKWYKKSKQSKTQRLNLPYMSVPSITARLVISPIPALTEIVNCKLMDIWIPSAISYRGVYGPAEIG